MKRRDTAIVLLAISTAALPILGFTQMPPAQKVWRIGVLTNARSKPHEDALWQELGRHGFVEGQNLVVHVREYSDTRTDILQAKTMELVRLEVDVLLVSGVGAIEAKKVAGAIPFVFTAVADPVGLGLVASLARPTGNLTGTSLEVVPSIYGKHVELLKEVYPRLSRIAVLWEPRANGADARCNVVIGSAKVLGVNVHSVPINDPLDYGAAFTAMARARRWPPC